jgi:hypothetical protein
LEDGAQDPHSAFQAQVDGANVARHQVLMSPAGTTASADLAERIA